MQAPVWGLFLRYNRCMPRRDRLMQAIQIIIVVLAIALVVLVFFFVRQYTILQRKQILNARELWISNVVKLRGAPTAGDVVFVQGWMTFDYVNQLFRIPSDYLEDKLSIADPHYPHITISGYARRNKLDAGIFLAGVDQAIVDYLTPQTSTPSGVRR